MTKEEAKKAMKEGKKVTHDSFSSSEWLGQLNSGLYEFEDGYVCRPQEFWRWRTDEAWLDNWHLFAA